MDEAGDQRSTGTSDGHRLLAAPAGAHVKRFFRDRRRVDAKRFLSGYLVTSSVSMSEGSQWARAVSGRGLSVGEGCQWARAVSGAPIPLGLTPSLRENRSRDRRIDLFDGSRGRHIAVQIGCLCIWRTGLMRRQGGHLQRGKGTSWRPTSNSLGF